MATASGFFRSSATLGRPRVSTSCLPAAEHPATGPVDPDHVRAEVGQDHARVRARARCRRSRRPSRPEGAGALTEFVLMCPIMTLGGVTVARGVSAHFPPVQVTRDLSTSERLLQRLRYSRVIRRLHAGDQDHQACNSLHRSATIAPWPSSTRSSSRSASDPASGLELSRPLREVARLLLARHPPADLPRARADGDRRLGHRRDGRRRTADPTSGSTRRPPAGPRVARPTGWPRRCRWRPSAASWRSSSAGRRTAIALRCSRTWCEARADHAHAPRALPRDGAAAVPRPGPRSTPARARPVAGPARRHPPGAVLDRLDHRIPGGTRMTPPPTPTSSSR